MKPFLIWHHIHYFVMVMVTGDDSVIVGHGFINRVFQQPTIYNDQYVARSVFHCNVIIRENTI